MRSGSFSSLKVADWPQRDRELWEQARSPGSLFDDEGLAAAWRQPTVINTEYNYGTFLWWLASKGELDVQARPANRANTASLQSFISAYAEGHARSSVAAVVRTIADMVRVTEPEADCQWIYNLAHRLKRGATPVKAPAQRRSPVLHLIRTGDLLIKQGRDLLHDDPVAGAVMVRDGLLIVMTTALPLRRRNIAGLRIGHSLIRGETAYRVEFTGSETKNGRDLEGNYPESLTTDIDGYVEVVRPILRRNASGEDDGWLWLARGGQPMLGATISKRMRELTAQHVGVPLAAHAFRHSAATDIAIHDPQHVGIIKSVLGHASPLSAVHYNLAATSVSARRYQDLMADLRAHDSTAEEKHDSRI